MKTIKKTLVSLSAATILSLTIFSIALAQGTPATGDADVNALYDYLGSFYQGLLLPVGTVLAGLVILFGGIVYASSGGDPTKVQSAKSYIFGAISGLILLILASLIIKTITGQ